MRKKLQLTIALILTLFAGQFIPRSSVKAASFEIAPSIQHQPTRQGDLPIFYDLNGDKRPDQVQLFSTRNHKSICIKFAKGGTTELNFDVPIESSGLLFADDVDNDNALDLIWLSQNESNLAVIWRGDGRGNFTIVEDPSIYKPKLAQLLLSPFKPGVSAHPKTSTAGCVSRQDIDFAIPESHERPFVSFESSIKERTRPVFGLDGSLIQLQNRPPPFLS